MFNLKKIKQEKKQAQVPEIPELQQVAISDPSSPMYPAYLAAAAKVLPRYKALDPSISDINSAKAKLNKTDQDIMDESQAVNSDTLDSQQKAIDTVDTMQSALKSFDSKKQEKKAFNLKALRKEGQLGNTQGLIEDFNPNPDYLEQQEARIDAGQEINQGRKFNSHEALKDYLLGFLSSSKNPYADAWQDLQSESPSNPENVSSALKDFYEGIDTKSPENILTDAKTVYDNLYGQEGESTMIPGTFTHVGAAEVAIKKLAEQYASQKIEPFNLKKMAQHKTIENTILWNAMEKRPVDPFLRQPVSDWHIVERNKGFGLVVDNVWNIDWETIWRENVMDKYSRPYRDKDGNWVGGYIQKRFEVDKNIPETSNYQLKPGQKRRATPPQYGTTEARLQQARSEGKIEGAENTTKPFNWKEAQSKKKR